MNVQKLVETSAILIFSSIFCVVANMVGYGVGLRDSVVGIIVLVVIGLIGFTLSLLPYLNKIYAVIWISIVAIYASSTAFPYYQWVVATTSKMQFMAIATSILCFAGLSIGKDLDAFKKLSWRIVPVALAAISGTFIVAAVIAHFALKWEGAI